MTEEAEERSAPVGIGLSVQVSLMNVGRRMPSEQVSRYLEQELPVRAVFVRRLPPLGVPMGLGDELMLVLDVGASIVTLATALLGIYGRFVKSNLRESKHGTPGVHVEIRNANNDFALLTVTSEDPEVVISTLKERIHVVTSSGDGDGQQVEATIERSQSLGQDPLRSGGDGKAPNQLAAPDAAAKRSRPGDHFWAYLVACARA